MAAGDILYGTVHVSSHHDGVPVLHLPFFIHHKSHSCSIMTSIQLDTQGLDNVAIIPLPFCLVIGLSDRNSFLTL